MFELTPNVGLWNIRLGDSEAEVRQALRDEGLQWDESLDPFRWELKDPWCTLSFANDPTKRLVQISSMCETAEVYCRSLVGLKLHEALRALNISRFDDTVWSVGEVEIDFADGKPFVDSDQRAERPGESVLHCGTLWIKSLGLGLSLYAAEIEALAIRELKYVPRIGYGPLDEQTFDAARDPQTPAALLQSHQPAAWRKLVTQIPFRALLGLATLVTGAVLAWVIYTMVTDYQSWLEATPVTGKVVALQPEGPIPHEIVVEYPLPDAQRARTTIPLAYTTVRELGEEVEVVYRPSNPAVAMTRLQARDHFSSLSMNWLLIVPIFGWELLCLFPNYRQRWKKG
jgi:hypothetical protein